MTPSLISETARLLIDARRNHKAWDTTHALALKGPDESYNVQELITEQLGLAIGGWKTSAPDPHSIPIAAPIYAPLIYKSGTTLPASNFFVIGIEGEIAFRMKRDLPRQDHPYTHDDLYSTVGEMLPVIEIVDTRMRNGLNGNKSLILADNQSNGGLVIGTGISDWRHIDLTHQAAKVTVNGKVSYAGVDGNRAGDVFKLMAWAANHCASRIRPILSGDIVTTGTYTGMVFVDPGSEVVVDFPEIGRVEISFLA